MALDLTPFLASEDDRPHLCKPFTQNGFTYYTDGIVLVRVPAEPGVEESGVDAARVFNATLGQVCDATLPAIALPDKDPEPYSESCRVCAGLGYMLKCSECEGHGETECCECGNERECGNCSGKGEFKISRSDDGTPIYARDDKRCHPCEECEGEGTSVWSYAPAICCEIAPGLWISSSVYRRILALPNLRFCAEPYWGPHLFKFDGGDGCLMPMRPPEDDKQPDGKTIAAYIPLNPSQEAA